MLIYLLMMTIFANVACLSRNGHSSAIVRHTPSELLPVQSHPMLWQSLSRQEYVELVYPNVWSSTGEESLLPESHPLTRRIQHWIDRIDRELRQQWPLEFQSLGVPRPIAVVARTPDINAYVEKVSLCFDTKVRILGADPDLRSAYGAIHVSRNGFFKEDDLCLQPQEPHTLESALALLSQWYPSCRIEHQNETLDLPVDCTGRSQKISFSKGDGFGFHATANTLTFFSGLIERLNSESELIFIIAHELAHYYRAHPSLPAHLVELEYRQGTENLQTKPKGDAEIQATIARIRDLKRLRLPELAADQYIPDVLHDALANVAQLLKVGGEPKESSCEKFRGAWEQVSLAEQSLTAFSTSDRSRYLQLEKDFLTCSENIFPLDLEMENWESLAKASIRPDFLHVLSIPQKGSLADVFLDLRQQISALKTEQSRIPQALRDYTLGFYTIEQEADEYAQQILTSVGADMQGGIHAILALSPDSAEAERCKGLVEDIFAGKAVTEPRGNVDNAYPSMCFRAINLAREILAHADLSQGDVSPFRQVDFPGGGLTWREFQKCAQAEEFCPKEGF